MATGTKTGRIEQVNPADLTVSDNIREDTSVDDEFVNSIKENGVLQPPMVTDNDAGGYEIVFGHRRTLGAIKAGLTTIDVYVVDKLEAQAARVIDQLAENQQRKQLTRAEELGGYKTLALIGLTPAQIAKRTTTNRKVVDTALAVSQNEAATKAITEHDITLDQAATIVEFDGDKEAIKKLTETAENNPAQFDHVVAEQRKRRELRAHIEQLRAHLGAQPSIQLADNSGYEGNKPDGYPNARDVTNFGKPDDPFTELEPGDLAPELLGVRIHKGWMEAGGRWGEWARLQYLVLEPEAAGVVRKKAEFERDRPAEPETEEQVAAREAREKTAALAAEEKKHLTTATGVRREWLTTLLQRTKLPTDAGLYATTALLLADGYVFDWDIEPLFFELTGLTKATDGDDHNERHPSVVGLLAALAANPKLADRIVLGLAISRNEHLITQSVHTVRDNEAVIHHLGRITNWGYALAEAEQAFLENARQVVAAAFAEEEADEDDDTEGAA